MLAIYDSVDSSNPSQKLTPESDELHSDEDLLIVSSSKLFTSGDVAMFRQSIILLIVKMKLVWHLAVIEIRLVVTYLTVTLTKKSVSMTTCRRS